MGLFNKVFGKQKSADKPALGFRTFTDYTPAFTTWNGKVHEQELCRAAIERFSVSCSKLTPEIAGNSKPNIRRLVRTNPNDFMTWPQFIQRTAAMYEADGVAFVVPIYARDMETVNGLWPLYCEFAEVVEVSGEPWVRFHFHTGETSALMLGEVCVINKFQLANDYFGEPNCLDDTMKLMHAQREAQESAIRNGAKIRFIGKMQGVLREEDMRKRRDRFMEDNFSSDNQGGLMLYDASMESVEQVKPQSYVISSEEMERIERNVCTYFGTNLDILQNRYDEEHWGAYYEGKVEPFALALSEGLNKMLFTSRERQAGNNLMFSANLMEYASPASKRNMIRDMVDRGIMTINEGRAVLQMPPVPGGDVRVIRGEYLNVSAIEHYADASVQGGGKMKANVSDKNGELDLEGDDQIYESSDKYQSVDVDD